MSSTNASETDGRAPLKGIHKNNFLRLEIECATCLQIQQTVVAALVDGSRSYDGDVQSHGDLLGGRAENFNLLTLCEPLRSTNYPHLQTTLPPGISKKILLRSSEEEPRSAEGTR